MDITSTEYQKELTQKEIIKKHLNSWYGIQYNEFFDFFDIDLADFLNFLGNSFFKFKIFKTCSPKIILFNVHYLRKANI